MPTRPHEAALSPFAPYQPQQRALPEPLELDEPEVAPSPPEPTYEAPAAFEPAPAFEPTPAFLAPLDPEEEQDVERAAIAPSLVTLETGTGVPRVAPFIVDVPLPAQEAPPVSGTLVLRIGKLSANYPVTKEATVIGRPDSKVQSYPDIEIELDDAVSRRHSEVRHRDGAYFIVDLMSTNGTMLNGGEVGPVQGISAGPRRPHPHR